MTGVTRVTSGTAGGPPVRGSGWTRQRPCSPRRLAALAVLIAMSGTLLPGAAEVLTASAAHAGGATETYAVPGSRTLKISGLGFGHGIGMSQFGAEGMGELGKSYRQIMKFYFPGTSFARPSPPEKSPWGSPV